MCLHPSYAYAWMVNMNTYARCAKKGNNPNDSSCFSYTYERKKNHIYTYMISYIMKDFEGNI